MRTSLLSVEAVVPRAATTPPRSPNSDVPATTLKTMEAFMPAETTSTILYDTTKKLTLNCLFVCQLATQTFHCVFFLSTFCKFCNFGTCKKFGTCHKFGRFCEALLAAFETKNSLGVVSTTHHLLPSAKLPQSYQPLQYTSKS